MNSNRLKKLIKECVLEVLKESLSGGFDPQSQCGPNIPQDNPYPAINARMRKLEEKDKPVDENEHGRYAQLAGAGQFDPRTFEQKKYQCPKCKNCNAIYVEEHPDTDMNEMVLRCPDCI